MNSVLGNCGLAGLSLAFHRLVGLGLQGGTLRQGPRGFLTIRRFFGINVVPLCLPQGISCCRKDKVFRRKDSYNITGTGVGVLRGTCGTFSLLGNGVRLSCGMGGNSCYGFGHVIYARCSR